MGDAVKLVKENIVRYFVDIAIAYKMRIQQLHIVSPWIASSASRYDAVGALGALLADRRNATCTIVTRPPTEAWHLNAVRGLAERRGTTVLTIKDLHTKLYIMQCDGFRLALLGSPNLTPRANDTNLELAIEFRSTNEFTETPELEIIKGLIRYSRELTELSTAKLFTS